MRNDITLPFLNVIEPLSYETNKQRLLDLMAALSPSTVLHETSDEMVLLEALAYDMTYGDEKFNARIRAVLPSYATKDNLDLSSLNFYGITRLETESDDAFLDRSYASLQQSVTTGSDDSYISHTRNVDVRITDVFPYRSGEGETTIVWHSHTEQDEEELLAIQTSIEAVIFDPKVRSLCATSQTVTCAEVVYFDIALTLVVYSVFKKDEFIAEATKALRDFFNTYKIAQEVHLSKITSLAHLEGVAKVLATEPNADVVIGKEQVAVLREINIITEELQDV